MKPFTNTSIFQGWKQWTDDTEREFRAQYVGGNLWLMYESVGDAFVHRVNIRTGPHASARVLTQRFDDHQSGESHE